MERYACTTRFSTTPSWPRGRPTPRRPGRPWSSSTPRATSSRRCRVRATPTARRPGRGAHRRAHRQGHPATGRLPVRRAAAPRDRAPLPGQGRRPGRLLRGVRHRTPRGGAPRGGPAGRTRLLRRGRRPQRAARRPALPAGRRQRSATTSWSRTRSTTRSRACGSRTPAGSPWPARASNCAGAPAAVPRCGRTSRPRGTSHGSSTASSSRWPARTSCGPAPRRRAERQHRRVLAGTSAEGHPRRRRGRGVVRPAVRAGGLGGRPPPLGGRLRDLSPALARPHRRGLRRENPRGTRPFRFRASWTVRQTRPCCSTRWA